MQIVPTRRGRSASLPDRMPMLREEEKLWNSRQEDTRTKGQTNTLPLYTEKVSGDWEDDKRNVVHKKKYVKV